MMDSKRFDAMMRRARRRVAEMDKTDGGSMTPDNYGIVVCIGTVLAAVESGVRAGDFGTICDGIVMLEQIRDCVHANGSQ